MDVAFEGAKAVACLEPCSKRIEEGTVALERIEEGLLGASIWCRPETSSHMDGD